MNRRQTLIGLGMVASSSAIGIGDTKTPGDRDTDIPDDSVEPEYTPPTISYRGEWTGTGEIDVYLTLRLNDFDVYEPKFFILPTNPWLARPCGTYDSDVTDEHVGTFDPAVVFIGNIRVEDSGHVERAPRKTPDVPLEDE